jgi:hypothetical protein
VGPFRFSHRTPFNKLPGGTYDSALAEQTKLNLAYGLDIWFSGERHKVMNIEWEDGGRVDLVSFKRGTWEDLFLAMCSQG